MGNRNRACLHNIYFGIFFVIVHVITIPAAFAQKQERQSPGHEHVANRDVVEIWRSAAERHKLRGENIVFVELLLGELDVDSMILPKEDQSRLDASLDLYLKQFASRFKAEPEAAKKHCYWLAWLISNGIKRTARNQEDADAMRSSYEAFFDELILDINLRLLKKNGVDRYVKCVQPIYTCSQWMKEVLNAYYSNLHDDFLFPGFKSPLNETIKTKVITYLREACEVPPTSKPKILVLPEEVLVKDMKWYSKEIPKLLAYMITLRTIWNEYHKTPEWGFMDSESSSCDPEMGKWPIDVRFCPDQGLNWAAAQNEKDQGKEKEKEKR